MTPLASAAQMKRMDDIAIRERGIPSLDLMERAAEGIAAAVEELTADRPAVGRKKRLFLPESRGEVLVGDCRAEFVRTPGRGARRAAVFAGPGNNGGDGVAAARLLANRGWEVAVFLVGDRAKLTADTAAMAARLAGAGLELRDFPTDDSGLCELTAWCAACDVFVDALFGVGLCREVGGLFAAAIGLMNRFADIPTVAADIASGLSADTGKVLGTAVRAAVTVTFSMAKPGHFVDQGSLYTGRLIVHDIGIPEDILQNETYSTYLITGSLVRDWLPRRRADGHKGDFGKVLVVGGAVGYTGAPVLAARGALRSGAGLVTAAVPEAVWPIVAVKCDEVMARPIGAAESLFEFARNCDAVLAGPGLGREPDAEALALALLEGLDGPVIVDADGINALSRHMNVLDGRRGKPTVLTPHDGEFARLGGGLNQTDRLTAARTFAVERGCVLVLKGHNTIVALPDGTCYVNATGNSGMAKGGSGDVLGGMILSLTGQGLAPGRAAACAVYLHGRAGDLAAADKGEHGMTPGDLIEQIPYAIKELGKR